MHAGMTVVSRDELPAVVVPQHLMRVKLYQSCHFTQIAAVKLHTHQVLGCNYCRQLIPAHTNLYLGHGGP